MFCSQDNTELPGDYDRVDYGWNVKSPYKTYMHERALSKKRSSSHNDTAAISTITANSAKSKVMQERTEIAEARAAGYYKRLKERELWLHKSEEHRTELLAEIQV